LKIVNHAAAVMLTFTWFPFFFVIVTWTAQYKCKKVYRKPFSSRYIRQRCCTYV